MKPPAKRTPRRRTPATPQPELVARVLAAMRERGWRFRDADTAKLTDGKTRTVAVLSKTELWRAYAVRYDSGEKRWYVRRVTEPIEMKLTTEQFMDKHEVGAAIRMNALVKYPVEIGPGTEWLV